MRKTVALLVFMSAVLASCQAPLELRPPTASGTSSTPADRSAKTGDQVAVIYTGTKTDGSLFDASSKHGGEPLVFTLGAGQMIKGFDEGVLSMKVGEIKTLVIPPEKAYGPKTIERIIPLEYFQEKPSEQTVPLKVFAETITQSVPVAELPAGKGVVGATIPLPDGNVATVTALSGTSATVTLPNTAHPFAGKKIVKGLKGALSIDTAVEIVSVKGDQVTVRLSNPFFGKTLKPGLATDMGKYGIVRVVSVNASGAVLDIPNPAELAGETLTFQVQLVSMK